jgi:hypothetical protein
MFLPWQSTGVQGWFFCRGFCWGLRQWRGHGQGRTRLYRPRRSKNGQPVPDKPESSPPQPSRFVEGAPVAPSRKLALIALAAVLVAAAFTGVWMAWSSSSRQGPNLLKTGAALLRPAISPASQQSAAASCALPPATAVAAEKDGKFPLAADVSGLIAADITSFLVLGKEAAAAGRARDAEVAFLMSCRLADRLKGADSIESTDAKYQLGSHYARVALDGRSTAGAARTELLRRAELLYTDSLQAYRLKYGEGHEMARFAAEGLAAVRRQTLAQVQASIPTPTPAQTAVQTQAVQPVPVPEKPVQLPPAVVKPSGQQARPASDAHAAPSRPAPPGLQPRAPELRSKPVAKPLPGPSFDCTRARSVPEKMICSDAELSRLDRELSRIYEQAKNATRDSAAFRRQQEQEWRRRESTCRDRSCLLRWYAQRRAQLMNIATGRAQSQPPSSGRGKFTNDFAELYRRR